jgi:hypothetical protein
VSSTLSITVNSNPTVYPRGIPVLQHLYRLVHTTQCSVAWDVDSYPIVDYTDNNTLFSSSSQVKTCGADIVACPGGMRRVRRDKDKRDKRDNSDDSDGERNGESKEARTSIHFDSMLLQQNSLGDVYAQRLLRTSNPFSEFPENSRDANRNKSSSSSSSSSASSSSGSSSKSSDKSSSIISSGNSSSRIQLAAAPVQQLLPIGVRCYPLPVTRRKGYKDDIDPDIDAKKGIRYKGMSLAKRLREVEEDGLTISATKSPYDLIPNVYPAASSAFYRVIEEEDAQGRV